MRIRLLLPHQPAPVDLAVDVHDPLATVADLTTALAPDEPVAPIAVDGRTVRPGQPLDRAGITDGSTVVVAASPAEPALGATAPTGPVDRAGAPVVRLTVETGFAAGTVGVLPVGAAEVGRRGTGLAVDDPTVSARHARLELTADGLGAVDDLGSTNGTEAQGDRVTCGAARIRVEATAEPMAGATGPAPGRSAGSAPTVGTTVPLHRTPRPPWPPTEPDLEPPPVDEPGPPVTPAGAIGVVASLVVGGVMVVVTGSWTFALFTLIGPVVVVANAIDGRRRRRRRSRSAQRRRRRDLAALDLELARRAGTEAARRAAAFVGPVAAATAAESDHGDDRPLIDGGLRLWERRPGDPDAFAVRIGIGAAPWSVPIAVTRRPHPDDVAALIARHGTLDDVPVGLALRAGHPIALVGPRDATRSLARSIAVQVMTAHGPADAGMVVLAEPHRGDDAPWSWCSWLPHARSADGEPLLAAGPEAAAHLAELLVGDGRPQPPRPADEVEAGSRRLLVAVIDDPGGLRAGQSAARSILRAAATRSDLVPIVLVDRLADVPASCTTTIEVDERGSVTAPPSVASGPAVVTGTSTATADRIARRLARYDDPEVAATSRPLPERVGLPALVGLRDAIVVDRGPDRREARALAARWAAAGVDPPPTATIGVGADGPVAIDLAADGPHALIAGTTGAGKSELLRTLVASLALASSPDHLTFVLIDFKGGAAFDACAELPHVTGMVTDLDEHLAARAMRCLEAELRHRERALRRAEAADVTSYRRAAALDESLAPMPRLVVVIDEFATLKAELPDFVDALVGIAQRGRSLGVHLVLATQRPAGAVSDNIRANTDLRIALRVTDDADSRDVIDVPDAARIPRTRPGRALLRLGPGAPIGFQAALSTAWSGGTGPVTATALHRWTAGDPDGTDGPGASPDPEGRPMAGGAGPTDLDRLVALAAAAWTEAGGTAPRRPWPEPLPSDVGLDHPLLRHRADLRSLPLAIADDPDRQRTRRWAWHLDEGPLLAVGPVGSGTSTLAASAVMAACTDRPPADLHVYVLDLGAGSLSDLARLPHVGAIVRADDLERQRRCIRLVADEVDRRRHLAATAPPPPPPPPPPPAASGEGSGGHRAPATDPGAANVASKGPAVLLVVDGLGALRQAWDDLEPTATWERFEHVVRHGSALGVHVLATAATTADVPRSILAASAQRLALRVTDPAELSALGIAPSAAACATSDAPPAGRALGADGAEIQIAHPTAAHQTRAVDPSSGIGGPKPLRVLPPFVSLDDLWRPDASTPGGADRPLGPLDLVVGIDEASLATARLRLAPAGAAVVSGPPRSGRTSVLQTLAIGARRAGAHVVVVSRTTEPWLSLGVEVVDPRLVDGEDWSRRVSTAPPQASDGVGPMVPDPCARVVVLVDDADRTDDDHPVLSALALERPAHLHLVVAARSDRLRTAYGHWTRSLRADRCGLILMPDPDLDGELLSTRLPRRLPCPVRPGIGWLTDATGDRLILAAEPVG